MAAAKAVPSFSPTLASSSSSSSSYSPPSHWLPRSSSARVPPPVSSPPPTLPPFPSPSAPSPSPTRALPLSALQTPAWHPYPPSRATPTTRARTTTTSWSSAVEVVDSEQRGGQLSTAPRSVAVSFCALAAERRLPLLHFLVLSDRHRAITHLGLPIPPSLFLPSLRHTSYNTHCAPLPSPRRPLLPRLSAVPFPPSLHRQIHVLCVLLTSCTGRHHRGDMASRRNLRQRRMCAQEGDVARCVRRFFFAFFPLFQPELTLSAIQGPCVRSPTSSDVQEG